MRKFFNIIFISIITIFIFTIIFLTTQGIKTNYFNGLINEKVSEINQKIKLNLNKVNFKLDLSKLEFTINTSNPKVLINKKKIDLEFINFNLNILDYLNNKNPISNISIQTKENDINQFIDFINEYDFNLSRKLILNQIKKGKIKISSDINFDDNKPNKLRYNIDGTVVEAELKLPNQLKINDINFDFQIDKDFINLNKIQLSLDKIFITSDEITINKENNQFEVNGNFKTKKTMITLNNYSKIFDINLDILNDKAISLGSENKLSFKINNKFKIKDLNIISKLNFDELYTKSEFQNFIYLKNGDILVHYNKKELKIDLESQFLFLNENYNSKQNNNYIKAIYKKKQSTNAKVKINLNNKTNKINSKELKNFIFLKNISLPDQNINFDSENIISFELNKNNEFKNIDIKSKIKTDEVYLNYKSERINRYFSNFKNQVKLSRSNLFLHYDNKELKLELKSKYSFNDINENINLNIKKKDNNYSFYLNLDLDSAEIKIDELDYIKKEDIKSNLNINGIYKENNEIMFKNINFNEEEKKIIVQNLEIAKNDKIKNLDLFKIDLVNKYDNKIKLEFKKVRDNYYLIGEEFDGKRNIKNLLNNSSKSIFSNFKNLDTYIYIDIDKYFLDDASYLSNTKGEIQIKNNKIINSNINAKLNEKNKFQLNIYTNKNKEKITSVEIEKPEPFIKNYKFIKGFKEGSLKYKSSEYDGKIVSNLKINEFKVKEVPVLAKLLTLASLQGIADLLTGEGIRFTDFEMDYETLGNTTNIKEMYAIGPAISLMMEGYIVKNELTSLKGTLVPATTINKTISKIPMLGEILVGKKIGEGVFGVSFKIKGQPKKLKTTVNPIKTLTPRFITRTLEKITN